MSSRSKTPAGPQKASQTTGAAGPDESGGDSARPVRKQLPGQLAEKLSLLPAAPGVYLHKNKQGKVIYVGKAKRLNQRVRSYFQDGERDPKTTILVRRIADVDYIVTDSETAALVLENQLIKEHKPLYNVRLKDDKQYPYLRISLNEAFARVTVVRSIAADGARYFGPYTDVSAMRETLKFAAAAFQVRTCHLDLPEQSCDRPCLDYQIGRCSAPCVGYVDEDSYRREVRRMIAFLDGNDRRVVAALRSEMQQFSKQLRYEDAARRRDLIARLERTVQRTVAVTGITGSADVCGLARDGTTACGVVLRVRQGRVLTTHHFQLSDRLDRGPEAFQAQLLREYYPRAGDLPSLVLVSHPLEDRPAWESWLGALRGRSVKVKQPQRGAKRKVVEMAVANAAFKLGERALLDGLGARRQIVPADVQLQEALGLHTVPESIECFDISNFQGRETVASLVYFKGGKPLKSRYRRFRIKTVTGVDDFASMREVLERYYRHLAEKEQAAADLIVVDGGAGQLGVARRVLTRYGLHSAQLIGLAKREEEIYREGEILRLPRNSAALRLLQRVRDEAHRFAITYHRLLRDQKTTASILDRIPGIGRIKKLSLLHQLGSVERIRRASAADLAAVRGIGRHDVASILTFFATRTEVTSDDEGDDQ